MISYQGFSAIRKNIDIFDSLSQKIAEDFIKYNHFNNLDTLYLSINGKDDFLIRKHIFRLFNNLNLTLVENETNSALNSLDIVIEEMQTSLIRTPERDSLIRKISVRYSFFPKENGIIKKPVEFLETYQDKVLSNDVNMINNENFSFAKAEIPGENPTFFEQIIEPLIIVTAAVITVILLFTIRSN